MVDNVMRPTSHKTELFSNLPSSVTIWLVRKHRAGSNISLVLGIIEGGQNAISAFFMIGMD